MRKLPGKVFTVSHQVSSNATFLKENLDLFAIKLNSERTEEAFSFKQCCQNDLKNQSVLNSRSMCHSQNTAILNLFQVLLNMSNSGMERDSPFSFAASNRDNEDDAGK